MTKLFTEDEVIKLCTAIRNRPSLYDPADSNFGKSLANKAVWDEIAAIFSEKGFTADDVKLKWKNLRDTMALLLRKSNRDPNTWRFYEYCSFLNNYERPPRKNGRKFPTPKADSTEVSASADDKSNDEPPEKRKPTMIVNAKTEDVVEQSDSSRDSNFEDTHDSILKHFTDNSRSYSATRMQTTIQSPYPSNHSTRDIYDVFGEETALRLRAIDASGRALFVKARRKINEILDEAELELYSKNGNSANGC